MFDIPITTKSETRRSFFAMPRTALRLTVYSMNDSLLFALELHKAKHYDLLRQAAEYRLGKAAPPKMTPWGAHLAWVLAAAVLGAAIPAVFAGFLRLPRALYLIPHVALSGAFLYAYARWSRTRFLCWPA